MISGAIAVAGGGLGGFFAGMAGYTFLSQSANGGNISQIVAGHVQNYMASTAGQNIVSQAAAGGTAAAAVAPSWASSAATTFRNVFSTPPASTATGRSVGQNNNSNTYGNPTYSSSVWDATDLGTTQVTKALNVQSFQNVAGDAGFGAAGSVVGNRLGAMVGMGTAGYGVSLPMVGAMTLGAGADPNASHPMFAFGKAGQGGLKRWALSGAPNVVPASGVADSAYRISPTVTGVVSSGSGVSGVFPMFGVSCLLAPSL